MATNQESLYQNIRAAKKFLPDLGGVKIAGRHCGRPIVSNSVYLRCQHRAACSQVVVRLQLKYCKMRETERT